jgi:hypothetical protein
MREDNQPPNPPERSAEELKELARQTDDPGERAWYLQWAKAFDRLAEIGGRKRKGRIKPN